MVIQNADKGNTAVITNRENYLEDMKSLLSDNSKFIPLNIEKRKWLNYIVNLKKKLKKDFKTLENNIKISEYEFKSIFPIGTHPDILYGLPNVPKSQPTLSAIGTRF